MRFGILHGFKALLIVAVILIHIHDHPFGKRVYHRCAHAVQTAGIGVIFIIEFSARMQLRIYDLHRRYAQLRMNIHGHAAAVIAYLAGAVLAERDRDFGRVAVGCFVNRVIYNFPDQMMQSARAGRTDIHAGSHTHSVQPLQYGNIRRGICLCHFVLQILSSEYYTANTLILFVVKESGAKLHFHA